jgi:hypothetical protein
MALLDDELASDLPPLPEGFRLVEPAKGSAVAPARAKPSLPPLPDGFRLVDPAAKAVAPVAAEAGGFLDSAANIAKGAGERVTDLAGGALRTAGAAIETIRQAGLKGAELGNQHRGAGPTGDIAGQIEAGNIDLTNRPKVKNADGSISTVRSMSFRNDAGEEVLIPTVADDGSRVLSDQEAKEQYGRTGKHLGKFSSARRAGALL